MSNNDAFQSATSNETEVKQEQAVPETQQVAPEVKQADDFTDEDPDLVNPLGNSDDGDPFEEEDDDSNVEFGDEITLTELREVAPKSRMMIHKSKTGKPYFIFGKLPIFISDAIRPTALRLLQGDAQAAKTLKSKLANGEWVFKFISSPDDNGVMVRNLLLMQSGRSAGVEVDLFSDL